MDLGISGTEPNCRLPILPNHLIFLREDGSFEDFDPVFEKGTTIMAFMFEEGIIVAADHSSKSSKCAENVVELSSHMVAAISEGSEFLLRDLQKKCQKHERMEGRRIKISEALLWLTEDLSSLDEKLSTTILIGVWDEEKHGVYGINGNAEILEASMIVTGSGSGAACGDFNVKYHDNMSLLEAANLGKEAICVGAYRAPESGDLVSVYHLGSEGCKNMFDDDIVEWHEMNTSAP